MNVSLLYLQLFSSHSDEKVKTELVLSITPHIIRARQSPAAALAEYWTVTELNAGRGFTQPRTREEISKLFKAGVALGSANKPARHLRRIYRDPMTNYFLWGEVRNGQQQIIGIYSLATEQVLITNFNTDLITINEGQTDLF